MNIFAVGLVVQEVDRVFGEGSAADVGEDIDFQVDVLVGEDFVGCEGVIHGCVGGKGEGGGEEGEEGE